MTVVAGTGRPRRAAWGVLAVALLLATLGPALLVSIERSVGDEHRDAFGHPAAALTSIRAARGPLSGQRRATGLALLEVGVSIDGVAVLLGLVATDSLRLGSWAGWAGRRSRAPPAAS